MSPNEKNDRAGQNVAVMTDHDLDAPMTLEVVRWQKRISCVYLNDFRIAGSKPWGGGEVVGEWKGITIRELARAIPALRDALGLDYLGYRLAPSQLPAGEGGEQ